jgi:hypothetical protein
VEAAVRSQFTPYSICGGHSSTETGFPPSSLVFPFQYHFITALYSSVRSKPSLTETSSHSYSQYDVRLELTFVVPILFVHQDGSYRWPYVHLQHRAHGFIKTSADTINRGLVPFEATATHSHTSVCRNTHSLQDIWTPWSVAKVSQYVRLHLTITVTTFNVLPSSYIDLLYFFIFR